MSNLDCFPITYNCFEEGGLNWDVVRTLVDAGANVRVNSSAILWSAARERNCLMAAWLLDRGADVTGGGSNFALENAVENLDVEMIRLLLSRGARFSTFQSWMSDGPKSWLELAATCRSQYPKQWREVTAIINSQSPTPSDADDTRGKTNEFEPRPRMPI